MSLRKPILAGIMLVCGSFGAAASELDERGGLSPSQVPSPAAAKAAALRSAPAKRSVPEKTPAPVNTVGARAATTRDSGNCCFVWGGAGCEDPACQDSVCSYDPYCCQTAWDTLCVVEAGDDPNCDCGGAGGQFECPFDALIAQPVQGPLEPWSAATSAVTSQFAHKCYENFTGGVPNWTFGLDWWGLSLRFDGGWLPCDPAALIFEITFYEDAGGEPGPAACTYLESPIVTPTGLYSGPYEWIYFELPWLPTPCWLPSGWISIQSQANAADCAFLWLSGVGGDSFAYQDEGTGLEPLAFDLSLCLAGEIMDPWGACCNELTGDCQDWIAWSACQGPGLRFAANELCLDLQPPCGEMPGACCHPDGTCEQTPGSACADLWLGPGSQCYQCPCIVPCPAGGVPEDEPCGEDANGGCGMPTPTFEPVTCGEVICGTAWADPTYRDTDWYILTLDHLSWFTWTVEAEFPVLIFILQPSPGQPCMDPEILGYALADECTPASLMSPDCMMPGDYWLWVGPSEWGDFPCVLDYVARVDCIPCDILGACCDDTIPECHEGVSILDCTAPLRFGRDLPCELLVPPCGGCPEATIQINVFTDTWPEETSWVVTDGITGQVVCSSPPYTEDSTLVSTVCCLPSGCYNFTIYDSYGDGIIAPGGYAIYYEGTLVYSSIGAGWCCDEQSVNQWGVGCVEHLGACCAETLCEDNLTEFQCLLLAGVWYIDQACQEIDCGVTAPYISPLMDSCTQGNDCNLRPSLDQEWEVTIPYDGWWRFHLCGGETSWDTFLYLGTTRCSGDIASNDDYCGLQSSISTLLAAGTYYLTLEAYSNSGCGPYVLYIEEEIHEQVPCPPQGVPEQEPCGADTNGGCGMPIPTFEPISCNEVICGTGWWDTVIPDYRDTDWYEYVAPADDMLTFTVTSEFYTLMGLIEQVVPGQPGCANMSGYLNPYAIIMSFSQGSISFPVTAGGTYYLWIGAMFASPVDCALDADYVAELTGLHCLCGDFDMDGDVDVDDYYTMLDAFGACAGQPKYLAAADFDGDGCISLVDYQAWLVCYHDANGDDFRLPRPAQPGRVAQSTRRSAAE